MSESSSTPSPTSASPSPDPDALTDSDLTEGLDLAFDGAEDNLRAWRRGVRPDTPGDAAADPDRTSRPENVPQSAPHVPDRNMPSTPVAAASTALDPTAIRAEAIAHEQRCLSRDQLAFRHRRVQRDIDGLEKVLKDGSALCLDFSGEFHARAEGSQFRL